jgi:predicted amidohydrolase YtcJ
MNLIASITTFAAISLALTQRMPSPPEVTLAVVNARVWTANPRQPWATGIAVSGDRILSVGSSAEIAKLARANPSARVIDAGGGMVVPGFNDSHVHFV